MPSLVDGNRDCRRSAFARGEAFLARYALRHAVAAGSLCDTTILVISNLNGDALRSGLGRLGLLHIGKINLRILCGSILLCGLRVLLILSRQNALACFALLLLAHG